jgi:tetratricopeptide (TPR) repeat protein
LRLHNLYDEILLEPFSESEVAAYMADRMPATRLPEHFVRRLHAHTDGLPLFVANVADTLIAQAVADAAAIENWIDASSNTPLPVPDSLAGVIERQIGRLPADAQAMLEAASVSGMEFRASAVAQMLGKHTDWVSQQCDDLVRRKFWLRHVDMIELPDGSLDTRYAFLHALYQHVFYQRLPMPQRVQFHRRAAKWIEAARAAGQPTAPVELASHYERGHQPLPALRYYAEAAENAVAHFAPMEALNLTTSALKLLSRCPDGPERMEAELALVHQRGLASGQLLGIGAAETLTAFERARVLCDALPETPARAVLLNGLGLTRYVLADYPQASAIAERVRSLGERYDSPVLKMCGFLLRGMVHAVQAEHAEARETMEQGVAICEQMGDRIPFEQFVVDPFVSLRANLAVPLVYLGYAEKARAQIRQACLRARELGQPTARMLALWAGAMVELRLGEVANVAAMAAELSKVVEESMLVQGDGPARWLRGWAMAHRGAPAEGFRLIREGYESHARLGMFAGNTETLCHAAEALILHGDWAGAQRQLDQAIELAERFQENVEVPRIFLLSAQVALAQGDAAAAQTLMRDALAEGRERGSPYFELRALTAICEHPAATREDFNALSASLASLPEGHSTPLGARAAQLLTGG